MPPKRRLSNDHVLTQAWRVLLATQKGMQANQRGLLVTGSTYMVPRKRITLALILAVLQRTPSAQILYITTTIKCAEEMCTFISERLPPGVTGAVVETFGAVQEATCLFTTYASVNRASEMAYALVIINEVDAIDPRDRLTQALAIRPGFVVGFAYRTNGRHHSYLPSMRMLFPATLEMG